MTAFLLKYWLHIAIGLAVVGFCWWLRHDGYVDGKAEVQAKFDAHLAADKEATDKANTAYRAKEQKDRDRLAELGFQHERDKMAAQDEYERTVACLRSGGCGMQKRWSCPTGVSQTPAGSGEPDAAERDRQESAARIVRAADECDAQVRGLQDIVRTDRGN